MQKCQFCETRCVWKCDCSLAFFCNKHVQKHLNPNQKHLLTPTKNLLSPESQQKLQICISDRLSLIQQLENLIEAQTSSLISQLNSLQASSLQTLSDLKSSYSSLLSLEECSDSEVAQIESILTTKLALQVPNTLSLSEEIQIFYSMPLYKELLQLSPSVDESLKFLKENWGLILQSHTKEITSVAVSADKQLIVSTSDDSSVRLWDFGQKRQKNCWKIHKDRVNCAVFSPDQRVFVTGSDDCTVKVWELDDLEEVVTLEGHTKAVKALGVSSDSRVLVSGSSDQKVRLWSLESFECIQVLSGHSDSVNAVCLFSSDQFLASGSSDFSIKIWDFNTFTVERNLTGHIKQVNTLAVNNQSTLMCSASNDCTIKVWAIEKDDEEVKTLTGHTDGVVDVAFICADKKIVSSSLDKCVKVWRVKGECEKSIDVGAVVWTFGVVSWNLLVVGRDDVKLGVLNLDEESFSCFPGHSKVVTKVEAGDDINVVMSKGKDGTVRVWNLENRKEEVVVVGKEVGCEWKHLEVQINRIMSS